MSSMWKLIAGSALLGGLGAYFYASQVESRRYALEILDIVIGGDDAGLNFSGLGKQEPLKVLHLSDLHLCYPEADKVKFIEMVTDKDYDLVALTGDIFEDYSGMLYASSLLSRKPRLGAYAVLGNHDYYHYRLFHKTFGRIMKKYRHPPLRRDVKPMVKALEQAGYVVLRNEGQSHSDSCVHVVGVDYPGAHPAQLRGLFSQVPPQWLRLLLFHMPIGLESIASSGADLALGGHTHGGQICIPGVGPIITDSELPRHEASGLLWRGQTAFHISRGLGADPRTNLRFFCPPAATVLNVYVNQAKEDGTEAGGIAKPKRFG
ncbi:MAG: metallophosphoesterase [Candidatus Melainabacteria bacterium]|nr:metallophosphoesterase [Candidatus Melainabacteria bacterium]